MDGEEGERRFGQAAPCAVRYPRLSVLSALDHEPLPVCRLVKGNLHAVIEDLAPRADRELMMA